MLLIKVASISQDLPSRPISCCKSPELSPHTCKAHLFFGDTWEHMTTFTVSLKSSDKTGSKFKPHYFYPVAPRLTVYWLSIYLLQLVGWIAWSLICGHNHFLSSFIFQGFLNEIIYLLRLLIRKKREYCKALGINIKMYKGLSELLIGPSLQVSYTNDLMTFGKPGSTESGLRH